MTAFVAASNSIAADKATAGSGSSPQANYACGGTADQTTINAALAASGTVYLLPGDYHLTGLIDMTDSDLQLIGSGKATRLIMGSAMTTAAVRVSGPAPAGSWGTHQPLVENLSIDGTAASSSGAHGLEITGAVLNGTFRRLWVTNCAGHGVYLHSAAGGERPAYNLLDHLNVQNGSRDGIRVGDDFPAGTYAEHNDVRNCVVTFHTTASTYGLYATGNNNRITDCQFDYLQTGIAVVGGAQNSIKGCTFDRSITNAILLSGQGNHSVTDCMVSDHITSGGALVNPGTGRAVSQINGCSGNTFSGNHFLVTATAPWAYAFGEDSGCGVGSYGPSIYLGNHGGNINANQFSGAAPVTASTNRWVSAGTW